MPHLSNPTPSKSKPGMVSGPAVSVSSILSSGPIPGMAPCEVRLEFRGMSSGVYGRKFLSDVYQREIFKHGKIHDICRYFRNIINPLWNCLTPSHPTHQYPWSRLPGLQLVMCLGCTCLSSCRLAGFLSRTLMCDRWSQSRVCDLEGAKPDPRWCHRVQTQWHPLPCHSCFVGGNRKVIHKDV